MTYDPFNTTPASKLTRARWPRFYSKDLKPLEWGAGEPRKRPRAENTDDTRSGRPRLENGAASSARDTATATAVSGMHPPPTENGVPPPSAAAPPPRDDDCTIMGVPALVDDRVRSVVDFILTHCSSGQVEVEAKLGILMEKPSGSRAVHLVPVTCETPLELDSNKDTRFVSDVGWTCFNHLNGVLNARVLATEGAAEHRRVVYTRTKEKDVYWPGRVRETQVWRDGDNAWHTIRVQCKRRLGDLNVLCPGNILDLRYSASSEEDTQLPNAAHGGRPDSFREKDRISFRYQHVSVDMTVARTTEGGHVTTSYEVEVELADPSEVYRQACKYRAGDATSKLFEVAGALVNTVRLLLEEARNVAATNEQQHQ